MTMTLPAEFIFLKSVRFWKLVIIAVLRVLQGENVIEPGIIDALANILELVLGGSIIIRTVDRTADKIGKTA